jgi:hypothetical protein
MSVLKSFSCRKRGIGYAKVIQKKEEKERKSIKNGEVFEIMKTMGTQMPA